MRSKVAPRKAGVGLKRRREPSRRRLGWRGVWWESTEKKEASHLLGLKKRHQHSGQRSNRIRDPCVAYSSEGRGVGGPNDQIVSLKKAADERKQRSRKIIDEERENYRAKNESLQNTSTDSKRPTFVILINHASALIRKKRLSPTSKARRKVNQNKFMEKGGTPDKDKSFRKINSR